MRGMVKHSFRFLLFVAVLSVGFRLPAEDANAGFSDGIDRNAPDFVRVSVLRMGPGNELYSCVGHVAFRLECPTFKLDSCYSYESEGAVNHLVRYFAGKLKMGMFNIPTEEFLETYRKDGRGVWQYALDLPPTVKQRLWRHMDDLVAKGADVPYDYINRGCSKALLDCLRTAAAPAVVRGPETDRTIREVFQSELQKDFPWNIFFILSFGGTESDALITGGTPRELMSFLARATLEGRPILVSDPVELVPRRSFAPASFFTPTVAAFLVLLLALAAVLFRLRVLTAAFLVVQAGLGCFFLYLVSVSELPTSCWNWLIVPFNPVMPALYVALRGRWARVVRIGFAAVLLVWIAAFLVVPRAVADPAHLVLAAAYAVLFCGALLRLTVPCAHDIMFKF